MTDERVLDLARRAAELLPEPPAAHDAFGYLAWEELVLSTARRLGSFLDQTAGPLCLTTGRGLDGSMLLTLAALLACEGTSTASIDAILHMI